VEREVDRYCPELQGVLRARLFGELKRNCLAVVFYTPQQEEFLRARGSSYNSYAKLLQAIEEMRARFMHGILEQATHNHAVVANVYVHFLRDTQRLSKIKVEQVRMEAIRSFIEQHFVKTAKEIVDA